MTVNFVKKLKMLSPQLLLLHFWAKLTLGIGIGVLLFQYLKSYGWWIVILGLLMSMPGVYYARKS